MLYASGICWPHKYHNGLLLLRASTSVCCIIILIVDNEVKRKLNETSVSISCCRSKMRVGCILACLVGLAASLDLGSSGRSRTGANTMPRHDRYKVSVAVVMPHSIFKQKEYKKIIMRSALVLDGSIFEDMFDLAPYLEMVQPIPSPTEILGKICDQVSKQQ